MSDFLIKKIGHQELGYKNNTSVVPGVSRGQYFLVSKKYLDFFPPLKKEIPQDIQILNIVSHDQNLPSQAKYIYDNDKYHGSKAKSPRDEHRINLNLKINTDRHVYLKDDIIVIKKEIFLNEDEENEQAFVITRYRNSLNPLDYRRLLKIIDNNRINVHSKNYALVPKNELVSIIDHHDRLFGRVMSLEPIIPEIDYNLLKSKEIHDGSTSKKDKVELNSFEKQIKRIVFDKYHYKCLVSGIGYKWLEKGGVKTTWKGITAAHIKPRAHDGEYSAENIIPLLEPIHQLFDRGIFTINDDYCLEIHEKALCDPLLSNFHRYHKQKLDIPEGIKLSLEFINHHRKEVYGSFISGKQIRMINIQ
jgi:hypothetical protein